EDAVLERRETEIKRFEKMRIGRVCHEGLAKIYVCRKLAYRRGLSSHDACGMRMRPCSGR
ncbi:MAG: hypothetical protein ACI9MU_003889, partial [Alphaproteobacteria bacterium]